MRGPMPKFPTSVCRLEVADVVFRNLSRPWLNANEFAGGMFVWGVFIGMGVAVRRDQHFRLTALGDKLRGRKRTLVETLNRLVVLGVGQAACRLHQLRDH